MLDGLRRGVTAMKSPIVIVDDVDFNGIIKLIQAPNFQRRDAGGFCINREVGLHIGQDPSFLQPRSKTANLNQTVELNLDEIRDYKTWLGFMDSWYGTMSAINGLFWTSIPSFWTWIAYSPGH